MRTLFLLVLITLLSGAVGPGKMKGRLVPLIEGITLDGRKIDASFFKGKITLIHFFYVGCPPSMAEMKVLHQLNRDNRLGTGFQVLSIGAHTREQLRRFQENNNNRFAQVRRFFNVSQAEFMVMPECDGVLPAPDSSRIQPECNLISKRFKVKGYPASFLVDKNEVIRIVYDGFATPGKEYEAQKALEADVLDLMEE